MTASRHILPRGSILVVTIWLIAVLGLIVLGALKLVAVDAQGLSAYAGMARARCLAEAGIQLGMHPGLEPGDPMLRQEFAEGGAIQVELTLEEGKINPNTILSLLDTDPIKRLFLNWGLSTSTAAAVTDALADWVDADSIPRLHGAERDAYDVPGLPPNRLFVSLDEMQSVRGMERVAEIKPRWRDSFTLCSLGQVDIYCAEPEVLSAVTGQSLANAKSVVDKLAGRDGIRLTGDDLRFPDIAEASVALGLPNNGLLTDRGITRRIESRGVVGPYRKRLVQVARGFDVLMSGELPEEQHEP